MSKKNSNLEFGFQLLEVRVFFWNLKLTVHKHP